jgi:hypothetical protein
MKNKGAKAGKKNGDQEEVEKHGSKLESKGSKSNPLRKFETNDHVNSSVSSSSSTITKSMASNKSTQDEDSNEMSIAYSTEFKSSVPKESETKDHVNSSVSSSSSTIMKSMASKKSTQEDNSNEMSNADYTEAKSTVPTEIETKDHVKSSVSSPSSQCTIRESTTSKKSTQEDNSNKMSIADSTKAKSSEQKGIEPKGEGFSSKYYVPKVASKEKKIYSTFRQKKKKCRKTVSSSSEDSDARESAKLQKERIEMFDRHKAQRMKTKLKGERMQIFDFAQGENSDSMSLESIIEKVDTVKAIPIVDFDKFNASDERHADKGIEKKHKKWLKWKKQQDKDAAKRREVAANESDTAIAPENNLYHKYSDEDGELPDMDEGIQASM